MNASTPSINSGTGSTTYTKNEMVGITLQKVSDLLGDKCNDLMAWLQMKYPSLFRDLVLDIEFDKKCRHVNKKQFADLLHDYYGEWKKLKNEFDFI